VAPTSSAARLTSSVKGIKGEGKKRKRGRTLSSFSSGKRKKNRSACIRSRLAWEEKKKGKGEKEEGGELGGDHSKKRKGKRGRERGGRGLCLSHSAFPRSGGRGKIGCETGHRYAFFFKLERKRAYLSQQHQLRLLKLLLSLPLFMGKTGKKKKKKKGGGSRTVSASASDFTSWERREKRGRGKKEKKRRGGLSP